MDLFTLNSWIVFGVIGILGAGIGIVLQIAWMMRILIASYIALALVLIMPENLLFNEYAQIIYFMGILTFFTIIERSRFFDVANWSSGRFGFEVIILSTLTIFLLVAISCVFVPFSQLSFVLTEEVYNFLQDYIFYIAIAPLIFTLIFSKRLHY
jgi:hypothetical protein